MKRKGSGLLLIIILIVALLVAILVVKQMGGLGYGDTTEQDKTHQEQLVQQAQDAVNLINERMAGQEP